MPNRIPPSVLSLALAGEDAIRKYLADHVCTLKIHPRATSCPGCNRVTEARAVLAAGGPHVHGAE